MGTDRLVAGWRIITWTRCRTCTKPPRSSALMTSAGLRTGSLSATRYLRPTATRQSRSGLRDQIAELVGNRIPMVPGDEEKTFERVVYHRETFLERVGLRHAARHLGNADDVAALLVLLETDVKSSLLPRLRRHCPPRRQYIRPLPFNAPPCPAAPPRESASRAPRGATRGRGPAGGGCHGPADAPAPPPGGARPLRPACAPSGTR